MSQELGRSLYRPGEGEGDLPRRVRDSMFATAARPVARFSLLQSDDPPGFACPPLPVLPDDRRLRSQQCPDLS
jgi:hypothetical protein